MAARVMAGCLVSALMTTGCSTVSTRGFSCPGNGVSGWTRYSTPHVVFDTALEEPVARQVANLLEVSQATLRKARFQGLADEPVHVVWVSADLIGIASTLPDLRSGSIVGTDDHGAVVELGMRGPYVSARDDPANALTPGEVATIWRSVARLFTIRRMPTRPLWLEEGLAAYHEAAKFDGAEVVVGIVPPWAVSTWRLQEGPRPSWLLGANRCEAPALRVMLTRPAAAFFLVHYLITQRSAAFAKYISGLAEGQGSAEAWAASFPDLGGGTEALDREVAAYANQERFRAFGYAASVPPFEVQSRQMTCEEVRASRIKMFAKTNDTERLEGEVAALLVETPGSSTGHIAKARLESGPAREARVRAAIERRPEQAEAWAELADLLPSGDERWRAADRAAELGHGRVEVDQSVAAARLDQGKTAEAVALAKRLVERVPWSPRAATTLARGLALSGRCEEARTALRRAESVAAESCDSRKPNFDAVRAALAACSPARS